VKLVLDLEGRKLLVLGIQILDRASYATLMELGTGLVSTEQIDDARVVSIDGQAYVG
jgi:hypothetical protein